MSSPPHQTEAHLLALAPHTGDHLVLTCFSADDGLFTALLRPARAAKPGVAIVTSYNDMLSAHQPYATYPETLKAAVRAAGDPG